MDLQAENKLVRQYQQSGFAPHFEKELLSRFSSLIGFLVRPPTHSILTIDDLKNEAQFALLSCARRFEECESNFRTYATHRIKGAIIDALWTSGTHQHELSRTAIRISHAWWSYRANPDQGHPVSSEAALTSFIADFRATHPKVSEQMIRDSVEAAGRQDVLCHDTGDDDEIFHGYEISDLTLEPSSLFQQHEINSFANQFMLQALAQLPERKQTAFLSCLNGETLMRIGEKLGVSEGRACQIVTETTKFIRGEFAKSVMAGEITYEELDLFSISPETLAQLSAQMKTMQDSAAGSRDFETSAPPAAASQPTARKQAAPASVARDETGALILSDQTLNCLLEEFRTTQGRDPDALLDGPVWSHIDDSLRQKTQGVTSEAPTLKAYIRRQLPEFTAAYFQHLQTVHESKERQPLCLNAQGLDRRVWMQTESGSYYQSAIRWNLFAMHVKEREAEFGTGDLASLLQRRSQTASPRPADHPSLVV